MNHSPHRVLDHLLEGCQIIGFDWRYRYLNDAAARHGRMPKEKLLGQTMMEAYPGIENTAVFAMIRECMEKGTHHTLENEFTYPDGSKGWFELLVQPVPEGVFIFSIDISERKREAERAHRYDEQLEQLTRVVQDLSKARTVDTIAEIVRKAARALVNSDGATFVLRDGDQCYYFDEDAISPLWKGKRFPLSACISGWSMLNRKPAIIPDIYADKRIPHDAYRPTFVKSLVMVPIRTSDPIGSIGNYWASSYKATDEDLRILGALADSTSVAMENVRIYEELECSERRYRDLVENLDDVVFSLDHLGNFLYISPAVARLGMRPNDLLGKAFKTFVLPDDFPVLEDNLGRILAGNGTLFEVRIVDWKGEVHHFRVSSRATMETGQPPKITGVLIDITEQRRTELQFQQAQKMEAVGRLAGGIAHDFNNLLTAINGYAGFALDELGADVSASADIREIQKASDRAATLTQQLLAFSRQQVLQPKIINLNEVVSGIESMIRRILGEDVEFITELAPDLGNVKADPGQIEQVLMNLVVNSRDAMPEGGQVLIETANVDLDETYTSKRLTVIPGPHVMLSVTDTGLGMDEATQAKLFEPFFTTKVKGKGTGLGLATVFGIVKQSGGNIWVYSEPGEGTTFKIYLPRKNGRATGKAHHAKEVTRSRGSETILVVEDESAVRTLAQRILSSAGYHVLAAGNGNEALVLCKEHEGKVDLLLTDVVMPQMSGKELAKRAKKLCHQLKVLFMSGYTDNAIVHHGVLDPGTNFLPKPFNAVDLTRKVGEVLAS